MQKLKVTIMGTDRNTYVDLEVTPEEYEGIRKLIRGVMDSLRGDGPYVIARHEDGTYVRGF